MAPSIARLIQLVLKSPILSAFLGSVVPADVVIGHVLILLNHEHDDTGPTDDEHAYFESLLVPLALWEALAQ